MDEGRQISVTSDDNRVNVGNFDENGLNVNNNWDDNYNDNLGVSASRQSSSILKHPRSEGVYFSLIS